MSLRECTKGNWGKEEKKERKQESQEDANCETMK